MPPDAGDGLVEVLHRGLLDRAASDGSPAAQRALLRSLARDRDPLLPGSSVESVVERVRARVDGLGPLEPLLADPSVDEVMLNGGGEVWVERHGHLECTPVVVDERHRPRPHRAHRRPARAPGRPVEPAGRRPPPRRLAGERGRASAGRRRAVPHHPALRGAGGGAAARWPIRARRPCWRGPSPPGPTWWCAEARAPARPRCSTPWPPRSPTTTGSSPWRTPLSCGCPVATSSAWRPARPGPRATGRCASATSCATPCGCAPTASWWARSGPARPSTCCRP